MKKITREKLYPFLKKEASTENTLNVGSGRTHYDELFPNQTTLDISEKKNPDIVASACDMPIPDNTYGVIISTAVLEHIADFQKALEEMKRVTKPGGKIILILPFAFPLHAIPGDYFRFSSYGIRHMFGDWEDVKIAPVTNTFETIAVILQRCIFQCTYPFDKIVKGCIYLLMNFFLLFGKIPSREYSQGAKKIEELSGTILPSIYFVVAKKPE